MEKSRPGTVKLALVLTAFFLAGSSMALVIWHTLSDFLAGRPVEGGLYLIAVALVGVFVGLAWILANYLKSQFPVE